MIAFVYASACGIEKRLFWDQIFSANSVNLSLIIIGNFNCILNKKD